MKNPNLDRARIYVDFNNMLENDLVLLSSRDFISDSENVQKRLYAGLKVFVYMADVDENRKEDNLLAQGVVEENPGDGWNVTTRWCCRIDEMSDVSAYGSK
jgi:hypothetical protein